ncbi:hypothetical protein Vadar_022182 [Vaccinium darrowii]|uniref:Uncharacterized protein n=1 Tax=Vaccinium darrowii TaxID=229202 RepID=A0ACB7XJ72_9ERIC|nr:hypothetical protein Vadar_022182 [Vaccinium darrowii]
MLTEFFTTNNADDRANSYLYREFPQHYKWCRQEKKWEARPGYNKVIGRIYTVSPNQRDKFYLRLLLNHIRGLKSWDLLTADGVQCPTFKLAAERRGLLECDNSIRQCLAKASNTRMPVALIRMFVTILVYCEPTGVRDLWDDFYLFMIEDYPSSTSISNSYLINRLLRDLNDLLSQHNRTIADFDLPSFTLGLEDASTIPKIIQDELSVAIPQQDVDSIAALNGDQKFAFNAIIGAIERNEATTHHPNHHLQPPPTITATTHHPPSPPPHHHHPPPPATMHHHHRHHPPATITTNHHRHHPTTTSSHHAPSPPPPHHPPRTTTTTSSHHAPPPPTTPITTSSHHAPPPPTITATTHHLHPPPTTIATTHHLQPPPPAGTPLTDS